MDFLELILDGKIRGLGPRGCGPHRPGPPWTGNHCREPDLVGAWPPAPPAVEVSGRGAEEEEGSTGSSFRAHQGSERRWSGGATTVKAAAVGVPVRGSEEGRCCSGVLPVAFIGRGRELMRRALERNGRRLHGRPFQP
jgi:hypothetical protein